MLSGLTATLNAAPTAQRLAKMAPNRTGLPDALKTGIETLSGMSLDHVRVHRNSAKPAQLNAYAYAQGADIHVAPGREQSLPHEAWHVVQQAQGRVKPTMQMKGDVPVNDDATLEREADIMGARALAGGALSGSMTHAVPIGDRERGEIPSAGDAVSPLQRQLAGAAAKTVQRDPSDDESDDDIMDESSDESSDNQDSGEEYSGDEDEIPQVPRRNTRSMNVEDHQMLPNSTPSGHRSSIGFLPQRDEFTPLNRLADLSMQSMHNVGYYAPQTISYSSGFQPIEPQSRDRMSNEQGKGLLSLSRNQFGMKTKEPNAKKIVQSGKMPILPGMDQPRQIQSLHGVARSLGSKQSGNDPFNYAAGSQSSNLAMQSFEEPLGEQNLRPHFNLQTTFYSDPNAPIAHGISTEVRHNNTNTPSLIYNHSGYDTSNTQEDVKDQQSGIREHLRHTVNNPPPPFLDPSQIQSQHSHLSEQEAIALSTLHGPLPHTLTLGVNKWAENSKPMDVHEDSGTDSSDEDDNMGN